MIPAGLRRALSLKTGDKLTATLEADRLVMEKREAVLRRLQDAFAAVVPRGVSLADELIAERRAEAAREAEA